MRWFAVSVGMDSHPKTYELRAKLSDKKAEVYLYRLLSWLAQTENEMGKFSNPLVVEEVARWDGEPGKMVDAMTETGFLEKTTEGYVVHGWAKWNGPHLRKSRRDRMKEEPMRHVSSDALDGTEDEPKEKAPKKPRALPEQTKLVEIFKTLHAEKRKAPYAPVWKRDAAIISALVADVGPSEVESRMKAFFQLSGDKWLQKVGYDVPAFKGRFNQLAKSAEAPGHPINQVV